MKKMCELIVELNQLHENIEKEINQKANQQLCEIYVNQINLNKDHLVSMVMGNKFVWKQSVDCVIFDTYNGVPIIEGLYSGKYHRVLNLLTNSVMIFNSIESRTMCLTINDDDPTCYCLYDNSTDNLYTYEKDKKWVLVYDRLVKKGWISE